MKQQFLVDGTGTFKTYVYENNLKIIPASGTITVYKPGGTEKLIDAQNMTVGGDGLLYYDLTAVHNDDVNEDYRAVVSYVFGSITYTVTLFYDVVYSILRPVITDDDVIKELPQVEKLGYTVRGTADSGSATTIVDAGLKSYDDDFFSGGEAYSLSKEESRIITDFVSTSGTITIEAFSSAIAADEKYVLSRAFTREIQRAFEKIEERLKRRGKRVHLILDPYDLREVHILFAVAEICKGQIATEGEGSLWWDLWKDYERQAERAFDGLSLKYDSSNDGYISNSEVGRRMSAIKVKF